MSRPKQIEQSTFTFRVDTTLKKTFMAVTDKENKPVAQVLRDFMSDYVERKKRKEFEAEARRQSAVIAGSPEEEQVMGWIKDVADPEGWK